jgi:hypothetical protein
MNKNIDKKLWSSTNSSFIIYSIYSTWKYNYHNNFYLIFKKSGPPLHIVLVFDTKKDREKGIDKVYSLYEHHQPFMK